MYNSSSAWYKLSFEPSNTSVRFVPLLVLFLLNQFEVEEDLYFCHLATNRFISGENPQAENNSNGTDAYWRKIIIGGKNGITRGARLPISHLVQIVTVLQFKLSSMPAFGIDFLTHVQNFAISWQLWWGSIVFEHDTTFFCGAYIANWLSGC